MSESDRWEWCPSINRTTARVQSRWSTAGRNILLNHSKKLSDSIHPLLLAPYKVPAWPLHGGPTEVEFDSFIQNVWRQPHTLRRPTSKDCYIVPPTPSTCLVNLSWATPSQDFVRLLQNPVSSAFQSRLAKSWASSNFTSLKKDSICFNQLSMTYIIVNISACWYSI